MAERASVLPDMLFLLAGGFLLLLPVLRVEADGSPTVGASSIEAEVQLVPRTAVKSRRVAVLKVWDNGEGLVYGLDGREFAGATELLRWLAALKQTPLVLVDIRMGKDTDYGDWQEVCRICMGQGLSVLEPAAENEQ